MRQFILRGSVLDASLIWELTSVEEREDNFFIHPSFEIKFLNGFVFRVESSVKRLWAGSYHVYPSNPGYVEILESYEMELKEVRNLHSRVLEFWGGVTLSELPELDRDYEIV
jgi:hypothetical protein